MPRPASKQPVLRRSVALPQGLVKLAQSFLPPEQRSNLNGLVKQALEDFVRQHRYEELRKSLQALSQDQRAMAEMKRISDDFAGTERDGLK